MVESEEDKATEGRASEDHDEARPGAGRSRRNECPRIVGLGCAMLRVRAGGILAGEAKGGSGKRKNHQRGTGDCNGTWE